jgi:hypothetical protein
MVKNLLTTCSFSLKKDAVSTGTAQKMKELGFPTPNIAFGQVWQTSKGHIIGINGITDLTNNISNPPEFTWTYLRKKENAKDESLPLNLDGATFLPSANDIREQIEDKEKADMIVQKHEIGSQWQINHKSRHEIYAEAWLDENK